MKRLTDLWRNQRARHVLIAAAIACLLCAGGILSPVSGNLRTMQTRFLEHAPSGTIVFIGANEDLTNPSSPQSRVELASLLVDLQKIEPSKIIIDEVFDSRSTARADERLGQAIRDSSNIYLVRRHMTTLHGDETIRSVPEVAHSHDIVVSKAWIDAFGYIWRMPYAVKDLDRELVSLPSAISGIRGPTNASFAIDYSISYSSIPSFSVLQVQELLAAHPSMAKKAFGGKTIVIGSLRSPNQSYAIPGHPVVPRSIVSILAAETLIAGVAPEFGWLTLLFFTAGLLLLIILQDPRTRGRRVAYAGIVGTQVAIFAACVVYRSPVNLEASLVFLLFYGAMRLWVARQRASALIDEMSGLPTFKALERDLGQRGSIQSTTIIVAKVHHFDEVLSALSPDKHAEYVNLIADRLRITQPELEVYTSGGRYLAWMAQDHGDARLEAHLKGLRAVFATPLSVSGTPVDAVITFGVDSTPESSAVSKIASATTAADKTSESISPIRFANAASEADRIWNISLQARIDEALRADEIYVVYQPQIDLDTGLLFGAEALVRWEDPERGSISPSYFIEQCEQAGRMEALTRKVIGDALRALSNSSLARTRFAMSVNVSATLLGDHRVAEILEQTLTEVDVGPEQITLEITETARIADYDRARIVMERLRRIGVRLSIDDFGVGSASLETFHALPFDEIKIDRTFVSTISSDRKARRIVESIVNLGKSLGLAIVAEGVEDMGIVKVLSELRCPIAQGYYFGKPNSFQYLIDDSRTQASSHRQRRPATP